MGTGNLVALPMLPSVEESSPRHRTKEPAIHVENKDAIVEALNNRAAKRERRTASLVRKCSHSSGASVAPPVDSVLAATSNAPSSVHSTHQEETLEQQEAGADVNDDDDDDDDDEDDDDEGTDGSSSSSELPTRRRYNYDDTASTTAANTAKNAVSKSRASSPIRQKYHEEPKLWIFDGPEAGYEAAQWKSKFVPIITEHTHGWTIPTRTEFFDSLIEEDKDRYLPPLGAYYFEHPEHIPERPLSQRAQRRIEVGFKASPARLKEKQRKYFTKGWDWVPERPKVVVEPDLGPKGERFPGEDMGECEHCVKEAGKSRLRKLIGPVVRPVVDPLRKAGRRISLSRGSKGEQLTQVPSREGHRDDGEGESLRETVTRSSQATASQRDEEDLDIPPNHESERLYQQMSGQSERTSSTWRTSILNPRLEE